MADALWRTMVITHRYLGVACGLLMVMWFVSGIVMMYVPFPRITEGERMRALTPISWLACCQFGEQVVADNDVVLRAQVENLAGVPTIRLQRPGRLDGSYDLAHGVAMRIDADQAHAIALDAGPRIIGRPAKVVATERAETDQWTIGRLVRDRPLYRFAFDDPERTNIYVSGTAGQVVHWTTATQRFWNWLGTIPHFLYFADLRSNVAIWSQIVIWTSILGIFLTALGIYLGIAQFGRGRGGKVSPYRGLFYWHHIAGLVFGLVTLTWVFSGLVSMNPWGFLDGRRAGGEMGRVQGPAPKWSDVRASLDTIRARPSIANAVSLVTAPFAAQLFWLATLNDGTVIRLDANGNVVALTAVDLAQAAQRIADQTSIAEQGQIDEEDAYYFRQRRENFVLPAYRVTLGNAERTRYYLDPRSGAVLQRADADARWHRWLFGALHQFDFTAGMRARPLWDIIVLTLLLGGLGVTATGFYLACRRIHTDFVILLRLVGRRRTEVRATAPEANHE
jgi:uncharacterized iron-regulated membrane protein